MSNQFTAELQHLLNAIEYIDRGIVMNDTLALRAAVADGIPRDYDWSAHHILRARAVCTLHDARKNVTSLLESV